MLEFPDNLHFEAAHGWLGLGNAVEALAELDRLSKLATGMGEVLGIRVEVLTRLGRLDEALAEAKVRTEVCSLFSDGYRQVAETLLALGQGKQAVETLDLVMRRFSDEWEFLCHASRVAALAGDYSAARRWLAMAITVGDPKQLKDWIAEHPELKDD